MAIRISQFISPSLINFNTFPSLQPNHKSKVSQSKKNFHIQHDNLKCWKCLDY